MVAVVKVEPDHTESLVDQLDDHVGVFGAWPNSARMYPMVQTVFVLFLDLIDSLSSCSAVTDSSNSSEPYIWARLRKVNLLHDLRIFTNMIIK